MSQVTVNVKTTINLGNFENVVLEFGVVAETQPGEKTPDAIDRIYDVVAAKLAEKAKRFKE